MCGRVYESLSGCISFVASWLLLSHSSTVLGVKLIQESVLTLQLFG